MATLLEDIRFAFQPLVNLNTGGIVAVEMLVRGNVHDLVYQAKRRGALAELDRAMAVSALRYAADASTRLPLHINVLAETIAEDPEGIAELRDAVREVGRREHEIVLELGPPPAWVMRRDLLSAIDHVRACGFRVALDGLGGTHTPLMVAAEMPLDIVKLHPGVVRNLPGQSGYLAVLESVQHLCEARDVSLVVDGVDDERQLALLRRQGIRLVQGHLLARPARRPPGALTVPGAQAEPFNSTESKPERVAAGPPVTEFLSPARVLPARATADEARHVFSDTPDLRSVVLIDEVGRPVSTVDRNRLLVAVTGQYGYALHAKKPASGLSDPPRLMTTSTTALEALELISDSGPDRMYDDAVVVDDHGRCLGVIQAVRLLQGMTELQADQAAALNPLTRLPGSEAIAAEVERRIANGEEFTLSWLDIDGFKTVNDTASFQVGDELIRGVGRSLTDAAAPLGSVRVGHVGGDDFLLVAHPEDLRQVAERVLDVDRDADGMPVTLSLATLVCPQDSGIDYSEASRQLAPVKRHAKALSGSSWVISQLYSQNVHTLRGR